MPQPVIRCQRCGDDVPLASVISLASLTHAINPAGGTDRHRLRLCPGCGARFAEWLKAGAP